MNSGTGLFHALVGAGGLMALLWLVFLVFLFLLPFFILKIRNEVVAMNRKMDTLISLLGREGRRRDSAGNAPPERVCPRCNAGNRPEDKACRVCGAQLG